MNYIRHQNNVFAKMDAIDKIRPLHISLYLALFRLWNKYRFKNPITINRQEVMKMAKIGSPNTYTKALKDLELYGFIRYHPSFDPHMGSNVYLYTFDTGTCTLPVSKVIPYNKHINNTLSNNEDQISIDNKMNQINSSKKQFKVPPLEHIKIYFQQKGYDKTEAERFFNYYESNGWMVGGRSKMKDWKAAARNWMLNIQKFQTSSPNPKVSQTPKIKKPFQGNNYQEPL